VVAGGGLFLVVDVLEVVTCSVNEPKNNLIYENLLRDYHTFNIQLTMVMSQLQCSRSQTLHPLAHPHLVGPIQMGASGKTPSRPLSKGQGARGTMTGSRKYSNCTTYQKIK
jgi:hypothetical protein